MNLLGIWTYLQSRFNRDEKGASLIVAVGTHNTLDEFLDKGRAG